MPVATDAPTRSGSLEMSMLESLSAWRAAARIICAKRSIRRAALRSIHTVGSNSFSSQAKWTLYALFEWSNCVISAAPDSPASRLRHESSTEFPSGDTHPRPVITTRLRPLLLTSHPQAAVDEKNSARDERRLLGAEEAYRPGDVLRIAEPAERCEAEHLRLRVLRDHYGELRLDITGSDGVRAHVAAAELLRKRLREADDPGLRRRIVGLAPVAAYAHDRRDVHDRAGPPFHHSPRHRPARVEDRAQVRLDDRAPVFVAHAREHAVTREAGVVHEDVEVAGFTDEPRRVLGLRDVGVHRAAADLRGERLAFLAAAPIADDDGRSGARELERDRPTDAPRGTGDERCFPLEGREVRQASVERLLERVERPQVVHRDHPHALVDPLQ